MQTIDSEKISELQELDDDGSNSTLKELITLYLGNMPERLASLKDHLEKKNFSDVRKTAHSIRSASLGLGAEKLSQIAFDIEYAEESGELAIKFQKLISSLESEYLVVKTELQKFL